MKSLHIIDTYALERLNEHYHVQYGTRFL